MSIMNSTAQVWSNVGAGLNGNVNGLYNDTLTNRLYATGAFTGKVAYWNGTAWTVIPGYPGTFAGLCITVHGSDVVVGSDSIYVYNGSNWYTVSGMGTGIGGISPGYGFRTVCNYPPCVLNGMNDYIYFGGYSSGIHYLIQCDPSNNYAPTQIGPNLNSYEIQDLEVYNNKLYITGTWPGFIETFTTSLSPVPTTYTAVSVQGAKTYSGNIYFGNGMVGFNGVVSAGFIKYNGTTFASTGGQAGTQGPMEVYSGNLYTANSAAPGIKIWNGVSMSNIPSAIGSTIACLAVYNGELYAGGNFTTPFNNIAKYNANPTLVLNMTSSSVSCNGGNNGSATCTPTGGLPGFTYSWSPGSYTTASVSGLIAGTYTVKVIDASTMTKTMTVIVTQPSAVTANQFQTNVSCNGGSNASATVVASGGTPGYTYSWSPTGGTSSTASGFSQGAYSCVIKDANNCSITKNFNITQPIILSATNSQTNETSPSSNDGIANVIPSGGTPGYTYSWSPSGGSSQTASGLTGGTYTCLITDSKGCTTTQSFTITTGVATGITSYTVPVGISIYPNPSNGQFTVDAGNATIDVINSLGQNTLHLTVDSKVAINLDKPGMYLISINKNGKIYNSRLINQ